MSDVEAARQAFAAALTQAGAILDHTPRHRFAREARALALCGSEICGHTDHAEAAAEAMRAAVLDATPMIAGRLLRLVDALCEMDHAHILSEPRRIVAHAAG